MKLRLLLLILLYFSFSNVLLAEPPSYVPTNDGIIIFTDPPFTGASKAVKLEVVSKIIRVISAPATEIVMAQSLVAIYSNSSYLFWDVVSSKEALTGKTQKTNWYS